MQGVSFDNPFWDELTKYPIKFATPVFFGDSPYSSYAASLKNGTGTLLKLGDKYLGVTCEHVLHAYRCRKQVQHTVFHFGPVPIDPEAQLISENREHDLAIFDLAPFVGKLRDLSEARFVEPITWPPRDVSTEDVICLGGFPGIWREQVDVGHLRFYAFSSGAGQVHSISEHHIATRIQIEDCITEAAHGKVLGSLEGLSGGPVFVWRKEPILTAELVGFIYEYEKNFDLMRVTAAKLIRGDGTLV